MLQCARQDPFTSTMSIISRHVSAPRGATISCKGWPQEAALRMLMNNLDPEVAERPDDLVVYGGSGRAARSWPAFDAIVDTLRRLEHDETLIVQSGKPVAVFRTHPWAPRVLIANAMLVPAWATWEKFRDLEDKGLTMYGQMTAGSWIYIGTQGILQGTYETLAELARRHFGGTLAGRLVVTAGLGGMGGAQPLAVTMNDGIALVIEVDPHRIERRLATRYVDERTGDLDDALARIDTYRRERTARSIALEGNAADVLPELVRRGVVPDVLTDQTSAHDALNGYVPNGLSFTEAEGLRRSDPDQYVATVHAGDGRTRARDAGAEASRRPSPLITATTSARRPKRPASPMRSRFPGSCRSTFVLSSARGRVPSAGPRSRAIPTTSRRPTRSRSRCSPDDAALCRWIRLAGQRVAFQGLPARIFWLGYGERARFGLAINDLVRRGIVKAPIVIGRDHLDTGSVASPNRETEGMRDGSDAIADWPVLNALLNTSSGATWVSFHHGGGVGIGYSLHAGMVIVADGTREADEKLQRVLTCDPGLGVVRHADAGYPDAIDTARRAGIDMPSLDGGGRGR